MKKEDKQQFTLRITQANSTDLVVILYEMMLCYLEDAKAALQSAETTALPEGSSFQGVHAIPKADGFRDAIRKARGCLNELMSSLHLQYEPAPALMRLYLFCMRRLALAEGRRDEGMLGEVKRIIEPLCDAYRQIAGQNSAGPVMNNSQTVYAGLTYGRNTLTENMADQGANRGILV